jgi:hypothetical protein
MLCSRCGAANTAAARFCCRCGAVLPTLSEQKNAFLRYTSVSDEQDALNNAFLAALRRNPTYAPNEFTSRERFGAALKSQLSQAGTAYRHSRSDAEHVRTIQEIAGALSQTYGHMLAGGHLRIGAVQKALNLYLKFRWCLDERWATPPHCPIDRIVLCAAGISGSWTQLDSIAEYEAWIARLRVCAQAVGCDNLSEWELGVWSSQA